LNSNAFSIDFSSWFKSLTVRFGRTSIKSTFQTAKSSHTTTGLLSGCANSFKPLEANINDANTRRRQLREYKVNPLEVKIRSMYACIVQSVYSLVHVTFDISYQTHDGILRTQTHRIINNFDELVDCFYTWSNRFGNIRSGGFLSKNWKQWFKKVKGEEEYIYRVCYLVEYWQFHSFS